MSFLQTFIDLDGINGACTALFRDGYQIWEIIRQNFLTLNGQFYVGTGSPEGVVTAPVSSLYFQTDGGEGTTLWTKVGGTSNVGWRALPTSNPALLSLVFTGNGTPEGNVTAPVSSLYFQLDSTSSNPDWVKVSGTGNTGWKQLATFDPAALVFTSVSVTLTAAQVKALFTTPITLVVAAGPGVITLVDRISFSSTFLSTAYAGANNLEFRYTNASGAKVTADIANTTLNFTSGNRFATVAGVVTELQPVDNAVIVVCVPTANPTAGDSPITFIVEYHTINANASLSNYIGALMGATAIAAAEVVTTHHQARRIRQIHANDSTIFKRLN